MSKSRESSLTPSAASKLLADAIGNIERDLAQAYEELQRAKMRKDDATEEHKESQARVNGLVGELVRRVNGEVPLPLTTEDESA